VTPYYADDWLTVYQGDARVVLAELPAESVHIVVTSPPYWGLRDYGTATWVGGDPEHAHVGQVSRTAPPGTAKQASNAGALDVRSGDCAGGAVRVDEQIGLEDEPQAYVEALVAVFREVRRVLRSDGVVWINLGDSYAAQRGATMMPAETLAGGVGGKGGPAAHRGRARESHGQAHRDARAIGLKHKDLVGIPWRVAFALQADGWYLRSDIIWAKPNPMPESVTDRPTKSHEYLFLLSKNARYYYDAEAVREPAESAGETRGGGHKASTVGIHGGRGDGQRLALLGQKPTAAGRNLRSVWTIATQPYPGAHFATFPTKLVEPCIKAGTSERGVCPECGAPWERVVEVEYVKSPVHGAGSVVGRHYETGANNYDGAGMPRLNKQTTTTGWRPPCSHDAAPIPATVLDPFAGSGTTGVVAQSLSRRAILIDLSMDYLGQLMERNRHIPLGLGA